MKGIVKQLSIFVNNEPGALAHLLNVLLECEVEIKAFNIAESEGFGVLRAIVANPEENAKKLKAKGVVTKLTDVISIAIPSGTVNMKNVVGKISELKTNIEYAYAHPIKGKTVLFVKAGNCQTLLEHAKKNGVELIDEKDLE